MCQGESVKIEYLSDFFIFWIERDLTYSRIGYNIPGKEVKTQEKYVELIMGNYLHYNGKTYRPLIICDIFFK